MVWGISATEYGHALCISQQEITFMGILLSAYIIVLLCVLVGFMTHFLVIYIMV